MNIFEADGLKKKTKPQILHDSYGIDNKGRGFGPFYCI